MPNLQTRIAAVQDTTYPEAENLAPADQLNVRLRNEGYRRHNFAGLNAFLVELFRQHDDVLGVRKTDFMAPPARRAAATSVVSASSCSVAPAFFAWMSMQ